GTDYGAEVFALELSVQNCPASDLYIEQAKRQRSDQNKNRQNHVFIPQSSSSANRSLCKVRRLLAPHADSLSSWHAKERIRPDQKHAQKTKVIDIAEKERQMPASRKHGKGK